MFFRARDKEAIAALHFRHSFTHSTPTSKMAAISAVAPVLNKAPVVSTGKAANTNSMMVWQPHGNK